MSKLETAARPVLVSLIDHVRTVESLSADERTLVSKWAGKTAYLHSWTGPLKDPVQASHVEALCGENGAMVAGVGVFTKQDEYAQPSGYVQTGHWPQLCPNPRPDGVATPGEAYKVGLQYRNLYLLVAFWPDPNSTLTRAVGMHLRLFPLDGPDPEYEFPIPKGEGPIHRIKVFTEWLGVQHLE
jgi:hypothetical protein